MTDNQVTIDPQQFEMPQEKINQKKRFSLLKTFIFEGIFVLVLLSVFFFILNFFNVIHLDSIFSFLPHAKPYVYDSQVAYTSLSNFITATLQKDYVPPLPPRTSLTNVKQVPAEIIKSQRKSVALGLIKPLYSLRFHMDKKNLFAALNFHKNSRTIDNVYLHLIEEKPIIATVDSVHCVSNEALRLILEKYFLNIPNIINASCKDINSQSTVQEVLYTNSDNKKGYGIQLTYPLSDKTAHLSVFSCLIFPSSPDYMTKTSCYSLL